MHRPFMLVTLLTMLTRPVLALEPSGTSWRSIDLPGFRLIYPESLEDLAQHSAAMLEAIRGPVSQGFKQLPRQIPLLLHPHSADSNGFVSPVPFKSEWLTSPPADPIFGASNWMRLLATHEYRHAAQFESLHRGWSFGTVLQALIGPQAMGLAAIVTWPRWFAEGDAVLTETLLTDGGRGRLPSFYEPISAALLDGMDWDLLDLHYGSYTRYVPGPYEMGYFMAAKIRTDTKKERYERALNQAKSGFMRRFYMTGLYHALNSYTRVNATQWIKLTLDDLDRALDHARALTPTARLRAVIPRRRSRTNYYYPQPLPDGRLLAFKISYEDASALVALDAKGNEDVLLRPELSQTGLRFHVRGGQVALVQTLDDVRWDVVSSSDIFLYDLQGDRLRRLSEHGRYFHPWISDDGRRLAASWIPGDGSAGWVAVFDLATGIVIGTYPAKDGALVVSPVLMGDRLMAIVRTKKGWHGLVEWDEASRGWNELLRPEPDTLADLWAEAGQLYVMSSKGGASEIFQVDPAYPALKRLTLSRAGSQHPSVHAGTLTFSDRDGLGLRPARCELASLPPQEPLPDRLLNVFEPLLEKTKGKAGIDATMNALSPTALASQPFSPWSQAFDLIGWNAIGILLTSTPEISFQSLDPMETLYLEATFGADTISPSSWGSIKGQYLQSYLPIDAGILGGTFVIREEGRADDVYEATQVNSGLTLPLSYSHLGWQGGLQAHAGAFYRHVGSHYSASPTSEVSDTDFAGQQAQLSTAWLQKRGAKHLQAPLGLSLQGALLRVEALGAQPGWAWASLAQAGLYLPGLLRHHGLLLEAAYEHHEGQRYAYGQFGRFASGYAPVDHPELYTGSVSYVFPLGYPDWKIKYPGVMLKRSFLRASYDETWGSGRIEATYRSVGGLLYNDLGLFYNDFIQLTLGLGARYLIDAGATKFALDFRTSF